jgi:hypothetical protein
MLHHFQRHRLTIQGDTVEHVVEGWRGRRLLELHIDDRSLNRNDLPNLLWHLVGHLHP